MVYHSSQINNLLILVRHGQAIYTPEEDRGETSVEGNLTPEGIKRIKKAGNDIKDELVNKKQSEVLLLTSPKKRCLQSCEIIKNELVKNNIKIQEKVIPQLRDVRVIEGSYSRWEKNMLAGENWFTAWRRKSKGGMKFYTGEESPNDLKNRIEKVLPKIIKSKTPTIIVCHEEVLGAIAEILKLKWTRPDYGEIWKIYPHKLHFPSSKNPSR